MVQLFLVKLTSWYILSILAFASGVDKISRFIKSTFNAAKGAKPNKISGATNFGYGYGSSDVMFK
tara:strand:+ start:448 stop:642 length:195 start_codon:yes stop_codon:yes gene_type:complete